MSVASGGAAGGAAGAAAGAAVGERGGGAPALVGTLARPSWSEAWTLCVSWASCFMRASFWALGTRFMPSSLARMAFCSAS